MVSPQIRQIFLPPFEGPDLKVKRAGQHVTELRELAAEFGKTAKLVAVPVTKDETHHLALYI
jgi:hypothetical protein